MMSIFGEEIYIFMSKDNQTYDWKDVLLTIEYNYV